MLTICVDDEEIILEMTVSRCERNPKIDEVKGFTNAKAAIKFLKEGNRADLALLDIDMPEMNGITLAAKLKDIQPDIAIIFVTGYAEYAVKAFEVHVQGYLLKPISEEKLAEEIDYVLAAVKKDVSEEKDKKPHIFMRTFGSFDMLVDDTPISFTRAKSKELLAYLVDRQGATVTRAEAFAAMYEDEEYSRAMQKQFDVIVRGLKQSLKNAGAEEVFEMQRGAMRVNPDTFTCDLYLFMEGDVATINSYRGEYMSAYYWAEFTEGLLTTGDW